MLGYYYGQYHGSLDTHKHTQPLAYNKYSARSLIRSMLINTFNQIYLYIQYSYCICHIIERKNNIGEVWLLAAMLGAAARMCNYGYFPFRLADHINRVSMYPRCKSYIKMIIKIPLDNLNAKKKLLNGI